MNSIPGRLIFLKLVLSICKNHSKQFEYFLFLGANPETTVKPQSLNGQKISSTIETSQYMRLHKNLDSLAQKKLLLFQLKGTCNVATIIHIIMIIYILMYKNAVFQLKTPPKYSENHIVSHHLFPYAITEVIVSHKILF